MRSTAPWLCKPHRDPLADARGSASSCIRNAPIASRDRQEAVRRCARSHPESGLTLLELLIVVALIGLLAGLSYPSAAAGIDSLRLRSAGDRVVSFLNTALERANRRQQVVEIRVSPADNALSARSADLSFDRTLSIPEPVHITGVEPAEVNSTDPNIQRRFLIYPGGSVPAIGIELASREGRKRRVTVDPVTGMPHSEVELK